MSHRIDIPVIEGQTIYLDLSDSGELAVIRYLKNGQERISPLKHYKEDFQDALDAAMKSIMLP